MPHTLVNAGLLIWTEIGEQFTRLADNPIAL
jgi:hypothetical protein